MKRKHVLLSAAAVVLVAILIVTIVVVRGRVQRHRVFRPSAGEARPQPPKGIPPVEQWTATLQQLEGKELQELLESIESRHPDLYKKHSLAYLHARVLAENNEKGEAAAKLAPFLEKGNEYRDLALYHRASIADDAEASRYRMALITEHPQSPYRDESIDEEIAYLAERDEPQPLLDFAEKIAPAASTERRREMSARVVEALADRDLNAALTRGLALLKGGTGDDAADRVVRALDKPEVVRTLSDAQLAMFGETFQQHRHYDRAVVFLQLAIQRVSGAPAKVAAAAAVSKKKKKAPPPKKKTTPAGKTAPKKATARKPAPAAPAPPPANPRARLDELQFALGRSHFGAEQYADAQRVYLAGARATTHPPQKAAFFWHAARAAQLQGDDKTAEQLMTSAIAVKGKFPATVTALTQRLRTRLKTRRFAEAGGDLALLRKMAPGERAVLEGSLAYAVGMLAGNNPDAALSALNSVPANLLNDFDEAEFAYWRGRALEARDPAAAIRHYLTVLRSSSRSHFDHFARKRLDAMNLTRELQVRDAQVAKHVAAREWDLARRLQTDRVLLKIDPAQLKTLAATYREIPGYREVLELAPQPLPRFPSEGTDRDTLLMAMGLHDEAVDAIQNRWGLRPAREGLTRSLALHHGAASRESIYAIEVVMKTVPADFHPQLLPPVVRRLLYPRYFYSFIAADAKSYEADPSLVLSIMREESRFNPRAKSAAAARGLLQFIITTARSIGQQIGIVDVEPEDLYDPRVIIRLGAKYIAELAEEFEGNRYRTAAAYNAGPKQVALWARLQPGPGDDYFMTAVNFDETKHYIRKVMNSYEMYTDIYPP